MFTSYSHVFATNINSQRAPFALENEYEYEYEEKEELMFVITRGDEEAVTFDLTRTIAGMAEKDAEIEIVVLIEDPLDGEIRPIAVHHVTVGDSELFIQTVRLEVGRNIIQITAEKEEFETVFVEIVVRRKRREVKRELVDAIVLPVNVMEQ